MRWLITGGCGFIGSNLVRRLREEGLKDIRILDNLSVGSRKDLGAVVEFRETAAEELSAQDVGVQLVVGDILNAELTMTVAADCDAIVHLAANTGVGPSVDDPRQDCTTNVIGTLNMLEAARHNGVRRFVFASSGAPIGEVEPPIHEELAPHPVSPYGASKLAGEGYCSAYYGSFGVETVVLRFGNVYGPGSTHKTSVVAKFIKQALNGETLEIYGDGQQTRDFIYVSDLTRAVCFAAEKRDVGGEIFQIANNTETTVAELAKLLVVLLRQAGCSDVVWEHGDIRRGEVKRNFSNTSKAHERLCWTPRNTLEQGLNKTIANFLQFRRVGSEST